MTPKQEAELIEKMTDASYDGGMAAAFAIAEPIIRDEVLEEAANVASAGITHEHEGYGSTTRPKTTFEIAEYIRSLKSKGQKP
jgi:hypothetical protein